ncbi:GDSL-type esterase/lipase family protein [Variovorax sp. HJSM1_2]|uniref:GDSL-type esterase/lipase family protein n=1 Tax=Variovorax sp. HJSM1_2 TaxID=3366263 RepID=UPI003BBDD883
MSQTDIDPPGVQAAGAQRWATTWCASAQGPYPCGNATAQPCLDFAFPDPACGARDQSFRLIVKPAIWGRLARIRLTNAFGSQAVRFGGLHLGMPSSSAGLIPGSNQPVTFGGSDEFTLAPGAWAWSDPVRLPLVDDADSPLLRAHKLSVSFHVLGTSGPMTWHAKAMGTSYLTPPGAGAAGHLEDEQAFPFSTTSWFFLDAIDVMAPADTRVVVAMGDSITDGSASTLNGFDRWPDVLARRLQAQHGNRVAVLNAGIGGNRIAGPATDVRAEPFAGGPSMAARLERDVLSLSGVTSVIWPEGTNDFSEMGQASVAQVQQTMAEVVARLRAALPGVKVIGATNHSVLGAAIANHGSPTQEAKRRELNTFIREGGLFDAVADFDAATFDARTGRMQAAFIPDSAVGGAGDGVHPNRAGYLAMADAVPLDWLT